jgi:hypothetical protein
MNPQSVRLRLAENMVENHPLGGRDALLQRRKPSEGPFRATRSVPRASSDVDTLFGDWKRTQPLSRSREESIGDCGRDGRCAGLTDAARLLGAFNDRHRNLRHLCQMQHRIGMKIRLLDPPVLERDLAIERRGETVDDVALHLRNDRAGIDRYAAIDGNPRDETRRPSFSIEISATWATIEPRD